MSRYFDDSLHHIDNDPDYLAHYGRKGMRWGKSLFSGLPTTQAITLGNMAGSLIGYGIATGAKKVKNTISDSIHKKRAEAILNDPQASVSDKARAKRTADPNRRLKEHMDAISAQANSLESEERSRKAKKEKIFKDLSELKTQKDMEKYLNSLSEEDKAMVLSILKEANSKPSNRPRPRGKKVTNGGKGVSVNKV